MTNKIKSKDGEWGPRGRTQAKSKSKSKTNQKIQTTGSPKIFILLIIYVNCIIISLELGTLFLF